MQNILLITDGSNPDMHAVDFACYLANLTRSRITAIFMENMAGEEKPALKVLCGLAYVETVTAFDLPENKGKMAFVDMNEKRFCDACTQRGVNYHIYRKRNASVKEIIAESRFADLMLINADMSLKKPNDGIPSHFVKEIMTGAECPTVLTPYSFDGIDEILFAYDGSQSSVFAIKQFGYLFPFFKNKKITVLQIEEETILPVVEDTKKVNLLLSHFTNVEFHHMQGKPGDKLFGYLLGSKNIFVVMGAYGRSAFSNFFRSSTADMVVKTLNLPVFIAHN